MKFPVNSLLAGNLRTSETGSARDCLLQRRVLLRTFDFLVGDCPAATATGKHNRERAAFTALGYNLLRQAIGWDRSADKAATRSRKAH
jgi:hypothetical protein